jgi:hypothetical protein
VPNLLRVRTEPDAAVLGFKLNELNAARAPLQRSIAKEMIPRELLSLFFSLQNRLVLFADFAMRSSESSPN